MKGVSKETVGKVETIQGDIRNIDLPNNHFDIILAGAVLHHLREDEDWEFVFTKLFNSLTKGGCLMISDLIMQEVGILNELIWNRYGDYLEKLGGTTYRQNVLDYVAKEDSPRSLNFQLDLMKRIGFAQTEILHKNVCFAAYCGIK